ncbi:MAG: BatA domain-containing protein [Candidatus Delongbacteria bacterium]|nr:BatA domain-containing protein [Candidatus Delongbacteria bacterium]MBN2836781.1 BatA domain-containing protein [Candidatus Delongbacteria bacterium]
MSFFNNFYFYLLPIVLIPILIHILVKTKYKKIMFSSLYILEKVVSREKKRLNLLDILLLILRVCIFTLILFFFLSPYDSKNNFVPSKKNLLFFYIDNSPSTSYHNLLVDYKEKASDFLSSLNDCKLFISDNDNLVSFENSEDGLNYLKSIKSSLNQKKIDDILYEIDSVQQNYKDYNDLVIMFSDGKLIKGKRTSNYSFNYYLYNENDQIDFLSIDTLNISKKSGSINLDFKVIGSNGLKEGIANLYSNGRKINEREFAIDSDSSVIGFTFQKNENSDFAGEVKIISKNKEISKFFSINFDNDLKILQAGDINSESFSTVSTILKLSLKNDKNLITTDVRNCSGFNFTDFDLIVLSEISALDNYSIQKLKRVDTTIITFSDIFDDLNLLQNIYESEIIPKTGKILEVNGHINYIDYKNSVMGSVFEIKKILGSTDIKRVLETKNNDWKTILGVDDKALLLKKNNRYFLSTKIENEWSNLGENGILVAILSSITDNIMSRKETQRAWYYPNETLHDINYITDGNGKQNFASKDGLIIPGSNSGLFRTDKGNIVAINSKNDFIYEEVSNLTKIDKSMLENLKGSLKVTDYRFLIIIILSILIIIELFITFKRDR